MALIDEVKDYIDSNPGEFISMLGDALNSPDDTIYSIDYLDERLNGLKPSEIIGKVLNGDFSFNDAKYFSYDGYENLKSYSQSQAETEVKDYDSDIAEYIINNSNSVSVSNGLKEILDKGEE